MKGTLKRVMSGVLSVITIASAVAQPMTAYAAEPEKAASSFEAQYPELEAVKDKLAEDEILTANDYSIDYGSDFDIKVDFSGIEGINDAKVKVELYEAKNEAGDDFDTYQAFTRIIYDKNQRITLASEKFHTVLPYNNRAGAFCKPILI